jgi:hypothetical protein
MNVATFGVMPTKEQWDAAWTAADEAGELRNGEYAITLSRSDSDACESYSLGDDTYTCDQLWTAVNQIVSDTEGDVITVSDDSEYENVYQVFYPGTDRSYVEIGPDADELIEWASKFSSTPIESESRAIECLNFA